MDLKETDILGEDIAQHWYYHSKAKAMTKVLGKVQPAIILDVGAGSGFFSHHLLANSSAHEAWCVDICYDSDSDAFQGIKPIHYRRSIDQLNADLVLFMDVLEHVDDDVGLLNLYASKVPSGTTFLISVPAFQFLWSGHDVFLEHKRRYSLRQVEDVVARAGLVVKDAAYFFGMVFPIAATLRMAQKAHSADKSESRSQLTKHHPVVNTALRLLCDIELRWVGLNRAAGLTVFCVAQKA